MSNGPHVKPGRRVKDARGFKVKVFDVLHNETYWYSKTYSSLRNIKLAIAQGGFKEQQFLYPMYVDRYIYDYRMCVELYIYDIETWTLAAVRRGNGGTNVFELTDNVAFADMSVKATEALMYAQELGMNEEAYSDMFGSGTPCAGSFIGRTDIIEHMLEEARNGRQTEN